MTDRAAPSSASQAQRWERTLRRIDRVEVCSCGAVPVATLHGVGHRQPVRRPVSIATASDLALRGHPLHFCGSTPPPTTHPERHPERRHEGDRRGRLPL